MMPNKMKMKLSFALLSLKLDIIEISRHTSSWRILCENYALVSLSTLLSTMKGNTSSRPLLFAFLYDDQLGKNFFVISKRSRKRWKERLNLLSPSLKMRIDDVSYSNLWFHRPKSIKYDQKNLDEHGELLIKVSRSRTFNIFTYNRTDLWKLLRQRTKLCCKTREKILLKPQRQFGMVNIPFPTLLLEGGCRKIF